jgi:predicted RNA-binding protein YlxR (DUF448 family)
MPGMTHHCAADAGPRTTGPGSERLCAATGEVKPVDRMIRFVIGPDQAVVPDLKRRLPGRGIWITATRQALELAVKRKSFERSFKREVSVTCDLVGMTERLLEQAALDALAMSHKADKVAIGFGRIDRALLRERIVGLLHAVEAAPEGVRKLNAALNRREDAADIAVIDGFTTAQLDLALGRANVIHAALLVGPESETFLARAARLDCFRTGPMARLPAIGAYRMTKSAKAAGRRESMENHGDEPEMPELDRDRNG